MAFDISLKHPASSFDISMASYPSGGGGGGGRRGFRPRNRGTHITGGAPYAPGGATTYRTDFHVYLWPYDGSSNLQLDAAGISYYSGLGFNFTRDCYDLGGSSAINNSLLNAGVDFWAARSEWASIDLWWLDIEQGPKYYPGTAGDTHIVPDITSAAASAKAQWATHHATPFYFGSYGDINGYQTDDTISQQVSAALDFTISEIYQAAQEDRFIAAYNFAQRKTALAITTPQLMIMQRSDGATYAGTYNTIRFCYDLPQCNGIILWGTDLAAAGPTYYDAKNWMLAAKQFASDYHLTRGTPF